MNTRIELYQLIAPLARLGIWEQNLTTGAVYWNSIIRQILEVDDECEPDLEQSLQYYTEPDHVRRLLSNLINSRQPQQAELELVSAKGTHKWVKIRMNICEQEGVDKFTYGTLEDVSREVRMRQTMSEREHRFSQAFNHAPIGMALVSLKGGWIKVNKSLYSLLGYSEAEFTSHTYQDYTHPDDLKLDLLQMYQLAAGKIPNYSMEKRYFHKDGHIIWAFLTVSLVSSTEGTPLYFISQIKDITDSKMNAEIIRSQNDRLLNFAHIVSHNLRSYAGNIRMLTNIIVGEQDPNERANWIGMLNDNADSLLNTLSELNEIVKINDSAMLNRQLINIRKRVGRAATIVSALIKESRAKINIDVRENLTILFNPSYLESIFVNLITNSIKYRDPKRALVIQVSAIESIDKTTLRFSDNGLGIDLNLHGHKLFGMYKTFHGNKDARGVGLFLVKNQVEAMGGQVTAESTPGVGTSFTIEIKKI